MGPVLSFPINIYLIWYGKWDPSHQLLIKDFLLSLSITNPRAAPPPSVSQWWSTVSLYTDQTGANISRSVLIAGEYSDLRHSHGAHLTRLSIQQVIATAVASKPFPVDHKNGIYLILTSEDVTVQDFCRAVCGFHYFTFPSMVGYTLPYPFCGAGFHGRGWAWGAEPAERGRWGGRDDKRDRARAGVQPAGERVVRRGRPHSADGDRRSMRGIARDGRGRWVHWAGDEGRAGPTYNLNGRRARKFLVQWIWSPVLHACAGPNALD